jgi:hypothetical protein
LQYGLEDDEIVDNKCDDGKRMDHIVYSSLLAVCSKKMPHSYDVTDDSTEKWIEFMEPMFNTNANLTSIEYESMLIQNSMCHDTYFQKEIFGY